MREGGEELTEEVEEQLEAARLALALAGLVQLSIVEPLQRLGPLDEVRRRMAVLLELVAVYREKGGCWRRRDSSRDGWATSFLVWRWVDTRTHARAESEDISARHGHSRTR